MGTTGRKRAGKSTLLSLIYADNPQSYANTLFLFDRKRGSGESIWEIKNRIGYVSPEMHLYYTENVPAIQIVGSGFFDSTELYRKCSPEQENIALAIGCTLLESKLYITDLFLLYPSAEQRLYCYPRLC